MEKVICFYKSGIGSKQKMLQRLFMFFALLFGITSFAQTIRYVKANGNGAGSSWSEAGNFRTVVAMSASGDQIWVAAGFYQISGNESFTMKEGVKIYGGFPASGTPVFTDRNSGVNTVTLDGNGAVSVISNVNNGLTNAALLDGFTISNGYTTNNGGGMNNENSYPTIANCIFKNNHVTNWGGGIFNTGSGATLVKNCLFYNNSAGGGGGVFDYNGATTKYINVTFANNASGSNGGAIHTHVNSNVTAANCIFWGNTAGGSGAQLMSTAGCSITLNYSLVVNNSANIAGPYTGNNAISNNPLFVNASAGNYYLMDTSPARNVGNTSLFGDAATAKDLAGNPRVYGSNIDMGAYESQPLPVDVNGIMYVLKGATGTGSSWGSAFGELADALKQAKILNDATPGKVKQIWVAKGTYKPMYRADNLNSASSTAYENAFVLVNNVKVYGNFAGTETSLSDRNIGNTTYKTILSGDLGNNDVYASNGQLTTNYADNTDHVVICSGSGTPELDGFTITGGNGTYSVNYITVNGAPMIYSSRGGGLYVNSSQPIIRNIIFKGNRGGDGGAIWNSGASQYFNILMTGNTSLARGGGYFNGGNLGEPTLTNVTISGNVSFNEPAGIGADGNSPVHLKNSIVWNNVAQNAGNPSAAIRHYNNIIQGAYVSGTTLNPDFGIDMGGNSGADPLFTNTAIGDFTVSAASPAVNSGNNNSFTALQNAKDLAGNQRLIGSIIDIGAYENTSPIQYATNSDGVMYVVKGATGNGASWSNAVGELAIAVKQAKLINDATPATVKQIWVAKGTYKPIYRASGLVDNSPLDKNNAFVLSNNVKVYGHFEGTEASISQRNLSNQANKTILSGDLGNNDTYGADGQLATNFSDNAYHVIIAATTAGSEMHNFTVTGGNAVSSVTATVNATSPIAANIGSGIYIAYGTPLLTSMIVKGNRDIYGGSVYTFDAAPVFKNLLITGNYSSNGSSGFHIGGVAGAPVIINGTITKNTSQTNASGISVASSGSIAHIYNSILWGNTEVQGSAATPGIRHYNNIVQGSTSGSGWSNNSGINMGGNSSSDPLFTNSSTGDFTLQSSSSAVDSGIVSYFSGAADTKDLAGNNRVFGGSIDIGAYESPYLGPVDANGIMYVVKGATGRGAGWDNAIGELGNALKSAKLLNDAIPGRVKQIWVAKGVYKPMYRADNINSNYLADRANTFVLVSNVKVYGNFAGTESALTERNLADATTKTTLSGDLGSNDTYNAAGQLTGNYYDNAAHVVLSAGTGVAELDGFTITGGNGNLGFNVTVNGVSEIPGGAGSGIIISNAQPIISNVILKGNRDYSGGTIWNENAASQFFNLLIVANKSDTNCGGFCQTGTLGSPVLTNVTISKNASVNSLSAITAISGTVSIKNSIIWDNTSSNGNTLFSGIMHYNNIIQDGTVTGGSFNTERGQDMGGNQNVNPLFTNADAGDFTLKQNSPAGNAGNTSYFANAATSKDLLGNTRLYGPSIDLGPYERQQSFDCEITTTWNGTAWSNGIPTSTQYSAILSGDFSSTANLTACSLTVTSGNITVNAGHNLIIKGAVNVAPEANLVFENNANLLQSDEVSNSGNITYKRNSNPLYNLDYTIWSSPTTGSQTLKQFSPQTLDASFYVYNTTLNAYSNYTSASGIFGGNPATVTFAQAKGYLIRMPNELPQGQTTVFNAEFRGTPNNGTISIPLGTSGNRFNAVGNPYPSPINIHNFIDANQGQLDNGTLYFWRKTNNTSTTTYATITKLAYNANIATGGDVGGSFTGQPSEWTINGGQGFFVKAANGATSLAFNNTMRRAVNNGLFFRSTDNESATANENNNDMSRFWINIKDAGSKFSQTTIGYTSLTTESLDYGWDGRLLNDGEISLYTFAENTKLVIQARSIFTQTDMVALGFKVTTAGSYTISVNHYDGLFAAGQDIFIKDNLTGTVNNLKSSEYTFATEAGVFDQRFEIIYSNSTLGTETPDIEGNSIIIYQNNNTINVSSGTAIMDSIRIYDTLGRLIKKLDHIDSSETIIEGLDMQQQMLIVQVITSGNVITNKKIIH